MISPECVQRPQILIVDSDADSREALADILEAIGFCAMCVRDGDEALARLKDGPAPLLVVLDPEPTSKHGGPSCRNCPLCAIPKVIVTCQELDESLASQPNTAAHFIKPVNVSALLSAITSFRQALTAGC